MKSVLRAARRGASFVVPMALLVAASAGAHAQTATEPLLTEPVDPNSSEIPSSEAPSSEAPADTDDREISVDGRVFAGARVVRQPDAFSPWLANLVLSSARISLTYREGDFLKSEVTVEAADGDAEIRDGYVNIEPRTGLQFQAGRFKRPLSAYFIASRWDLPTIERGILSGKVSGRQIDIVGDRGMGVMAAYELPLPIEVDVIVAAFESEGTLGLLDPTESLSQDFYARIEVEPIKDLRVSSTVASLGYFREFGQAMSNAHATLGSLELEYGGSHLRAWAEGFVGESHFARSSQPASGTFAAGRMLVAPRFRTGIPRRLVPFVGASYFDPQLDAKGDDNLELQAGVNLAFSKTWRLQMEYADLMAGGDDAFFAASRSLRIQLAARFRD